MAVMGAWDLQSLLLGAALGPLVVFALRQLRDSSKNRAKQDCSQRGLRVVITGSTRGLGLALADRFLSLGGAVLITSRLQAALDTAAAELSSKHPTGRVRAKQCDVSDVDQVDALASFAEQSLGGIDIWVNNAGLSQSSKSDIADTDPSMLQDIVGTNLLGSMWGSRAAIRSMKGTPSGGKVFLIDGTGAWGNPTPQNIAYGATKRALTQLKDSLAAEVRGSKVSVHMASPGMVATDLLLGMVKSARAAHFINVLAEDAGTVASWLVPRMRGVTGNGRYFKFLTPRGVLWRMLTTRSRRNRFIKQQ